MFTYDDFSWTSAAELRELAERATPWEWYLATKVRVVTSDLSGVVCPVESGGESNPPMGPLHVITAIQPESEPGTDESIARMAVLDHELRAAGLHVARAVGTSFDGEHSEDSRAVFGLDDAQAREIGSRFGQVAVFSWAGPRWSLMASVGDRQLHRDWRWEAMHSSSPS